MKRTALVTLILALLLICGAGIGLALGPTRMTFSQLMQALGRHGSQAMQTLVWNLRAPRVAAALVVGACLGAAGHLLQSSTRNPLGDPQLFGVGGGAAIVSALSLTGAIRAARWELYAIAVAASLVGAALIMLLASRRGLSPARMALIGVSISALAAATATGMLSAARVFGAQPLNFIGGSFANLGWNDVVPALPFVGLGIMLALPVLGNLGMLSLGDQVAANMGAEPARTRALAIAASGILSGAGVAVGGLVGFIGLMSPHLARWMVGHDVRASFGISLLLGATLTLFADQAARLVLMPREVPVGLVSALVGAPIMIYVARRTTWS